MTSELSFHDDLGDNRGPNDNAVGRLRSTRADAPVGMPRAAVPGCAGVAMTTDSLIVREILLARFHGDVRLGQR